MPTPGWWSKEYEPARALDLPMRPLFAYNLSLLILCASDDYIWNISIAKHCALTFCAFHESCRFEVPSAFHHDPHMRHAKERDLCVLCAVSFRGHEFVEHHGIFRLFECTSVDPVVGYLAISQVLTVDWSAPGCVCWFSYSWDTSVVHLLEKRHATERDHGESVKHFVLAVTVTSLGRFIRVEDSRRELLGYCGK